MPVDVISKSTSQNYICKLLTLDQVKEISGSSLVKIETTSPKTPRCRFTLENGKWFEVLQEELPIGDISADCYDERNGSNPYKRTYQPYCMAVRDRHITHLQSAPYFGLSKPIMKALLERLLINMENNSTDQ
ncbi:MAG: hypothetical protein LBE21_08345 [Pseudomonadales bacterium]|jgi:hypothetical protein|nr:hypothetical protein [Pseudomonadales bacterium]